jgi:hypothetical protein
MIIDGADELGFDAACGPSEPQRDLPLAFRWRTDPQAIVALGLAPARTNRHEDARNAVLTEAKLAYDGTVGSHSPGAPHGTSAVIAIAALHTDTIRS